MPGYVPVKSYLASPHAGSAVAAGSNVTFTVNITQSWEIQVPAFARYGASVSLATAVYIYPSSDGGANFDTEPLAAYSIPTLASTKKQAVVRLTTGMYAIQIQTSSPSVSIGALTCEILSAFISVG